MSSETLKHDGARAIPDFAHTGNQSATFVSPQGNIRLSHGMPFQVLGICADGSQEILNHTGKRCKSCRWLHEKNTIVWSGCCGKHVTVRRCLAMSPCEGPVRRDP